MCATGLPPYCPNDCAWHNTVLWKYFFVSRSLNNKLWRNIFFVDKKGRGPPTLREQPRLKSDHCEVFVSTATCPLCLGTATGGHHFREGDKWKMAFSTLQGYYEYLVMHYRLSCAPSVFQSLINDVLWDLLGTCYRPHRRYPDLLAQPGTSYNSCQGGSVSTLVEPIICPRRKM